MPWVSNNDVYIISGNVGIGTSSNLNAKLTLAGGTNAIAVNTVDGSDNQYLSVSGGGADGSARGGHIYLSGNERTGQTGTVVIAAGNVTGGAITFRTASDQDRVIINNAGNVGIGATDPFRLFQVKTASGRRFSVTNGIGVAGVTLEGGNDDNTANIPFEIRGNPILLNANVGIGVSPDQKLHVQITNNSNANCRFPQCPDLRR